MATYKVGYFVGSLSSTSINRLLAKALERLAPPELALTEIPSRTCRSTARTSMLTPASGSRPQAVHRRCRRGALRHARIQPLDPRRAEERHRWASRPWGKNSFARKPSGVIGTSPGAIGTAVAQQSLRGVLCYCNSPLMNQVEAYIQFKPGLITDDGEVTDDRTEEFLRNYMTEMHAFIVRVLTVLPRNA